jgi:hypothetical protein
MKWTDYNGNEHDMDDITMLALKTCMDPSKQCVECPFNDKEQACYDLNVRYGELIDEYRKM